MSIVFYSCKSNFVMLKLSLSHAVGKIYFNRYCDTQAPYTTTACMAVSGQGRVGALDTVRGYGWFLAMKKADSKRTLVLPKYRV